MIKNKNNTQFSFALVQYDDVLKKVKKLNTSKASQQSDIPTKILRENSEFFTRFFNSNINQCLEVDIFPSDLKTADVTPAYKKNLNILKIITDQSVYFLIYLRYMKDVFTNK